MKSFVDLEKNSAASSSGSCSDIFTAIKHKPQSLSSTFGSANNFSPISSELPATIPRIRPESNSAFNSATGSTGWKASSSGAHASSTGFYSSNSNSSSSVKTTARSKDIVIKTSSSRSSSSRSSSSVKGKSKDDSFEQQTSRGKVFRRFVSESGTFCAQKEATSGQEAGASGTTSSTSQRTCSQAEIERKRLDALKKKSQSRIKLPNVAPR